jgi:hypothetical protein
MTASLRSILKTYFAIGAAISLLAIIQTQQQTDALFKLRTRYKWAMLIGLFAFNAVAGLYAALRHSEPEALLGRVEARLPHSVLWKILGWLMLVLPFPILWLARADFFGEGLEAFFRLLWLFWWLLLIQTAGMRMATRVPWAAAAALPLVLDGLIVQTYILFLPVTDYPFSMGWSEASRFYYGSLLFSKAVYGSAVPLSIWHGTRYMLLSIPFLLGNTPLWVDRLWQVLLWLGISGLTSWFVVRRLKIPEWTTAVVVAGWFFLYMFQGAVYYHLQVSVIIVLVGVKRGRLVRTLIAVLIASFWAGMSRLNWYPVPAMLAVSLYLLEEPFAHGGGFWRYNRQPVSWLAGGLLTAFAGQAFYISISGDTNLQAFGSSLTSMLLWYRWFPSATNPIGILPGVLIVSIPLWALVAWEARRNPGSIHSVRWLGLLGILLVLMAGGLVVSTKIGGGGDLHNMDAYMVMLGIFASYVLGHRVESETGTIRQPGGIPWAIFTCLLLVPVGFTILRVGPPFTYDRAKAVADVASIKQAVQAYSEDGPVLFIYERQLLTFGYVTGVPLVPEYEVVSLMEMAISGNEPYLNQFYSDLATHRFSAIVAHPQNLGVETGDFIEESNTWNRLVGQPLLCQYKPVQTLTYSKVQILVPRARPCPEFPPMVKAP